MKRIFHKNIESKLLKLIINFYICFEPHKKKEKEKTGIWKCLFIKLIIIFFCLFGLGYT